MPQAARTSLAQGALRASGFGQAAESARPARSESWLLEHIERTEGFGRDLSAMMNSIFALMALGHGPDDP